jgi:hypothetical protein
MMPDAGEGGILVGKITHESSSIMIDYEVVPPVTVKGRDAPIPVFRPLGKRDALTLKDKVRALVCHTLNVPDIPDELDTYFCQVVADGECSPIFVQEVCHNLVENAHIKYGQDGCVEVLHDLSGLENGLTRLQALVRGDFDNKLLMHVQMLAKVVCFLCHNCLFSVDLAKHVYSCSFPNFAQDFESAIDKLIELGVIQVASSAEILEVLTCKSGTCEACKEWNWQTPNMQDSFHVQMLAYKLPIQGGEGALSPKVDGAGAGAGAGRAHDGARKHARANGKGSFSENEEGEGEGEGEGCRHVLSEEDSNNVEEKEEEGKGAASSRSRSRSRVLETLRALLDSPSTSPSTPSAPPTPSTPTTPSSTNQCRVCSIPVPGLVETVMKSLLKTYQRIWHRLVAEFYEQVVDLNSPSGHVLLAHHWASATDHNQPEPDAVQKAVFYLHLSARAAIDHFAFMPAIEMLQRACRSLDRIPMQMDIANKKLELLAEMAPHTLFAYGHGSAESMAAYHGLHRLIPQGSSLDDRAVRVLAGQYRSQSAPLICMCIHVCPRACRSIPLTVSTTLMYMHVCTNIPQTYPLTYGYTKGPMLMHQHICSSTHVCITCIIFAISFLLNCTCTLSDL